MLFGIFPDTNDLIPRTHNQALTFTALFGPETAF